MHTTTRTAARLNLGALRDKLILGAIVLLAIGLVMLVESFFDEPLTEADRAEMLIDGTEGLPKDR